jgi:hypothetical protein
MEEETKKLLEENIEISRQSLKILKGMRRASRIATAFKILYWLIIVGVLAGTYYFLEPYIKSAIEVVQGIQQVLPGGQKTNGTQSTSSDLLKNLPPDLLKNIQDFLKTQ